ncbi:hypothetical protein [Peptostreptococcus equinus]|uniref:XRE family transcriptional regulator n=1 Tax=Peptostreptococcus equinus TaxID=3003601 RepID=A0ABY7JTK4_9FIRM|nr:hypothetical protein [Peptostreptococcus sp. CBA3647]WAW15242.1 hypothetical protein O0R46_01985 [Peptostreptococcus sp. CBA3647]
MNKNKLKAIMALHGDTQSDLAKILEIAPQTFSNKINERGSEFNKKEITLIKDKYSLSSEEVSDIFFN